MRYQILQGDAVQQLRTLPDESVHCVVADPPYGETSLAWDCPVEGWMTAVRRVLHPTGSLWVFGSLRSFMALSTQLAGWKMAQDVVWEKHNGSNAFDDRFRRVHELIAQFYRKDTKWEEVYKFPLYSEDATARTVRRKSHPQQWGHIGSSLYESHDGGPRLLRSVLCCRSEHGRALHPTQKPVALIAVLLSYSCPPAGVVLDPFCGSGSTGVAAKRLGCDFIGIELNPEFVAISRERIEQDAPLFNEAVP